MFHRTRGLVSTFRQKPALLSIRSLTLTPSTFSGTLDPVEQARKQAGGNASQGPLYSPTPAAGQQHDITIERAKGLPAKEVDAMLKPGSTATTMLNEKEQEHRQRGEPTAADMKYPTEAEGARKRQEQQGINHPDTKPGQYFAPDYQMHQSSSATRVATSPFDTSTSSSSSGSSGSSGSQHGIMADAKEKVMHAADTMKGVAHKVVSKVADAAHALKDKTAPSSPTDTTSIDSNKAAAPTQTATATSSSRGSGMEDLYKSQGSVKNYSPDQKSREL